ncbi:MAG: hypothetical protein JO069_10280 [Verrucomicrobia bacterium]|nr:hypothetical protein [Verrucomicrobiota bacterium]
MKLLRSGLLCALIWSLLPVASALALDEAEQQVIDAFRSKFDLYILALQDLKTALNGARSEADVVRATDRFCDMANRFVDEFNATREYYQDTPELKSLNTDPEAKKVVEDFMNKLQKRIEEAQPTFDNLLRQLTRYQRTSAEIRRVRDRVAATCGRIQLISF